MKKQQRNNKSSIAQAFDSLNELITNHYIGTLSYLEILACISVSKATIFDISRKSPEGEDPGRTILERIQDTKIRNDKAQPAAELVKSILQEVVLNNRMPKQQLLGALVILDFVADNVLDTGLEEEHRLRELTTERSAE